MTKMFLCEFKKDLATDFFLIILVFQKKSCLFRIFAASRSCSTSRSAPAPIVVTVVAAPITSTLHATLLADEALVLATPYLQWEAVPPVGQPTVAQP